MSLRHYLEMSFANIYIYTLKRVDFFVIYFTKFLINIFLQKFCKVGYQLNLTALMYKCVVSRCHF